MVNIVCYTPLFVCLDVKPNSTQNKLHFSTRHDYVSFGRCVVVMSILLHTHENGRILVVIATKTEEGCRNHGIYEHDIH